MPLKPIDEVPVTEGDIQGVIWRMTIDAIRMKKIIDSQGDEIRKLMDQLAGVTNPGSPESKNQ